MAPRRSFAQFGNHYSETGLTSSGRGQACASVVQFFFANQVFFNRTNKGLNDISPLPPYLLQEK
jgi:hypothetical protein